MANRLIGWRRVRCALLTIALVGCGTHEESSESLQQAQVDTVNLKVQVPTGVGLHQTAVGTTNSLEISDRTHVVKDNGVFATITNIGVAGTRLGVFAQSGEVWSQGKLYLQNNARVNGNAHAPGGVDPQAGATITGTVDPSPITPLSFPWTVGFQVGSTPIPVEPDVVRPLAPGAYGDVAVKGRATLSLTTGTYYLQSFGVETGAALALDTRQGPIFVYVAQHMHHRGVNRYTGDDKAALFVNVGTESVALGGPFVGSVVAPNAELALSPGTTASDPNRGKFKGSFFGKRVWVQPDITLTAAAFKHWDFVLPPQPFAVCVSKVGTNRYAALFGYENPLDRVATIAAGAQNALSGVLTGMTVPPITTFTVGRVEQALWVPFSSSVTWSIRGKTATATTSTPACPAGAYPTTPPPPHLGGIDAEGPSQNIAPSTPKPPAFSMLSGATAAQALTTLNGLPTFSAASGSSGTGSTTTGGVGVIQQGITKATGKFVIKLTSIRVPDGDSGGEQEPYISKFEIDGVGQSAGALGDCDEDSTCSLNITVEGDVPLTKPVIEVAIDIKEDDNGTLLNPDDLELEIRLKIDNVTGQVISGTAHSPNPDTTDPIAAGANCGGAEGWGICWETQSLGAPVVPGDVSVCGFWNAYFVDEGKGEDRTGIEVPKGSDPQPPEYLGYPAAFSKAKMDVRSAFVQDVTLPQTVFNGFLDKDGCMRVPAQLLVHRTEATSFDEGDLGIVFEMETKTDRPADGGVKYFIRDRLRLDPNFQEKQPPVPEDPDRFLTESVASSTPNIGSGGEIPVDDWAKVGAWRVPPDTIRVFHKGHTAMTNTAAAITAILGSEDPGIFPGTYEVLVNTGLKLSDRVNIDSTGGSDRLSVGPAHTNSTCMQQDPMTGECKQWSYSRPPCTTSADCVGVSECMESVPTPCFDPKTPGEPPVECMNSKPCNGQSDCFCRLPHQARWKYVMAHEAGHQIQQRASGRFATPAYGFMCPAGTTPGSAQCPGNVSQYTLGGVVDPPFVTDTCGCSHVRAANQEHCLQSVERSSDAQVEGIAQFYASRSWNREGQNCTFTYYKEFLDATCHNPNAQPGDCTAYITRDGKQLINTLPPAAVSCRQPARWRNKQECSIVAGSSGKAGDYGTEYDWMGFLYGINRPSNAATPRVVTQDLWLIYRHACERADAPPGVPPSANPDACTARRFVWDATNTSNVTTAAPNVGGFRQGLEAQYASNLALRTRVLENATTYGVGPDTTPLP